MQWLVHGTWGEEQFYQDYYLLGCGGEFGLPRQMELNCRCSGTCREATNNGQPSNQDKPKEDIDGVKVK